MNLSTLVNLKVHSKQKKVVCDKCVYKDRTFVPPILTESEIVIVGEAPGKMEAAVKSLFVGESGKLLRKLLNEVGIDDKSLSYLNIVYCNPPNNETPKKDTIKKCAAMFLQNDLNTLKPKVVVLVGSVALNYFFPKTKITGKRGNFILQDGITYFPVYHPSYCLRNLNATSILRSDLNKIGLFLSGNLYKGRTYTLCDTVKKLEKYEKLLLSKEILAVDIETNSNLDPFADGAKMWSISFGYDKGTSVCVALDHPENVNINVQEKGREVVRNILKSKINKVFHNGVFDVKWLRKFGYEVNGIYADTMIMSFLLDENRLSHSLKILASEFLTGYQFSFTDTLKDLSNYNCEDTDYTLQLYHLFNKQLENTPKLLKLLHKVIIPFCNVIVDMELTGILIDKEYATKLKGTYQKKLIRLHDALLEEYPRTKNINLASPQQLSNFLFKTLKFQPIRETKTGYSVDHETLTKLSERQDCVLAKYILKIRGLEKALSTYIDKIPHIAHSDGRLRGGFNIIGTRTGRLSSQNPNLQNIPRNKDIKKMFYVPKGYQLLNVDASQAELRVGCSIANEKTMIKAYNEGMDIHTLTASRILNKSITEVSKSDRQKAKGVNFGFIYGASAEGFMYYAEDTFGLKLSIKECREFRQKFFTMYSGFLSWYTRTEVLLKKQGYIEYPTGRFARFPLVKGYVREIPSEILRKAVNYPVQGSSSDIVLYTMVCLRNFIKRSKLDAKIIITVHDSIVLECNNSVEQDIIEEVKNIAQYDLPKYFPWLQVPMVFDYAVGDSWGELNE